MSAAEFDVPKAASRGKTNVFDERGRPISVTREKYQRPDSMIQENRRIKQNDIDRKLEISRERLQHITETAEK